MSSRIWFDKEISLEAIERMGADTMVEHLGIKVTEVGDNYIIGSMPIDSRTVQPQRRLHGGASVVLAETLGSIAANLCLDRSKKVAFGQSINASHLRPGLHGPCIGRAEPIHLGRSSQVWEIKIHDQNQKLICLSRLTMTVVNR